MRSVFFFLTDTTREEISAWLSEVSAEYGQHWWRLPVDSDSPVLYIKLDYDLSNETEPEDCESLRVSLGGTPAVTLVADVSGRVPGDAEVRQFAALVLGKFHGVASDDYTRHCWTLAEIQSGVKVDGHAFFDYDGWYQQRHNRPPV